VILDFYWVKVNVLVPCALTYKGPGSKMQQFKR